MASQRAAESPEESSFRVRWRRRIDEQGPYLRSREGAGIDQKALVALVQSIGVTDVRNHMSSVDAERSNG